MKDLLLIANELEYHRAERIGAFFDLAIRWAPHPREAYQALAEKDHNIGAIVLEITPEYAPKDAIKRLQEMTDVPLYLAVSTVNRSNVDYLPFAENVLLVYMPLSKRVIGDMVKRHFS